MKTSHGKILQITFNRIVIIRSLLQYIFYAIILRFNILRADIHYIRISSSILINHFEIFSHLLHMSHILSLTIT